MSQQSRTLIAATFILSLFLTTSSAFGLSSSTNPETLPDLLDRTDERVHDAPVDVIPQHPDSHYLRLYHHSEVNFLVEERSSITVTVVGGLVLIKKAGTLAIALGKGLSTIGGVAGGVYALADIKDYFEENKDEAARLADMSYDTLYELCHDNNGGMVSTTDVTQNAWGDSYIFGVPERNAVCVSN